MDGASAAPRQVSSSELLRRYSISHVRWHDVARHIIVSVLQFLFKSHIATSNSPARSYRNAVRLADSSMDAVGHGVLSTFPLSAASRCCCCLCLWQGRSEHFCRYPVISRQSSPPFACPPSNGSRDPSPLCSPSLHLILSRICEQKRRLTRPAPVQDLSNDSAAQRASGRYPDGQVAPMGVQFSSPVSFYLWESSRELN